MNRVRRGAATMGWPRCDPIYVPRAAICRRSRTRDRHLRNGAAVSRGELHLADPPFMLQSASDKHSHEFSLSGNASLAEDLQVENLGRI
jgi:hypothetical protein